MASAAARGWLAATRLRTVQCEGEAQEGAERVRVLRALLETVQAKTTVLEREAAEAAERVQRLEDVVQTRRRRWQWQ